MPINPQQPEIRFFASLFKSSSFAPRRPPFSPLHPLFPHRGSKHSLLVVRPHAEDLNRSFLAIYLIDQPMLEVDSSRIRSR